MIGFDEIVEVLCGVASASFLLPIGVHFPSLIKHDHYLKAGIPKTTSGGSLSGVTSPCGEKYTPRQRRKAAHALRSRSAFRCEDNISTVSWASSANRRMYSRSSIFRSQRPRSNYEMSWSVYPRRRLRNYEQFYNLFSALNNKKLSRQTLHYCQPATYNQSESIPS
jgi:hypothetical protein